MKSDTPETDACEDAYAHNVSSCCGEAYSRMMELSRNLERERNALRVSLNLPLVHATDLIEEIMRDEVNAQDECEKWLRAYAPDRLMRPL